MNKATGVLIGAYGIRYRTGKTLVPFRLTGNIEWGVPAPVLEGEDPLTIWVWPGVPLGAYLLHSGGLLEQQGMDIPTQWKDFWCSARTLHVYQFIGAGQHLLLRRGGNGDVHGHSRKGEIHHLTRPNGEMQLPILVRKQPHSVP